MSVRLAALLFALALAVLLPTLGARAGDDEPPAQDPLVARKALMAAIARGKALWNGSWGEDTKSCAECHSEGPNRMRMGRVRSYPKYDYGKGKVIGLQQKLAQMVAEQCKATPLPLGHDDLVALEAYLQTVR